MTPSWPRSDGGTERLLSTTIEPMTPAERSNLVRHEGQNGFYEIWFVVFFERGQGRATWIRYTTFVSNDGTSRRATLWAASFDNARSPRSIATKTIYPHEMFRADRDRFAITIGEASMTHGTMRGGSASGGHRIAWELDFDCAHDPAPRTPTLADRLPLATRAAHANTDVAFRGWVEVDGVRRRFEAAIGAQIHIWGSRRIEQLAWVYVPERLEVTSARPKRSMPTITSVWLPKTMAARDRTQFPFALTNRLYIAPPNIIDVRAGDVRIRAFCDSKTMVGYVYRDPDGHDLYVAQSDLASVEVERFERVRLRRQPKTRWSCAQEAALEIHGLEPLPGIDYIPWDATTARPGVAIQELRIGSHER